MSDQRRWCAGVDWGSQSHCVFLTDGDGRKIGEKVFNHGGEGLAETAAWLMAASGAVEPGQILTAIEIPHGPVVETLIERSFKAHAINPKQMNRFRDRFTMAGAEDDSRNCACAPPVSRGLNQSSQRKCSLAAVPIAGFALSVVMA